MSTRCFFIAYALLSFFAASTSGLLWRGLRPKYPVEPLCETTYCPLGNQLACLIMNGTVGTNCISQWQSCFLYWLPKCWTKRHWPNCKLTRYGCACRC
uniref:Secreted protein n=1 Tax=Rhipicephalus zambeziensis TaxID=60191 RepID=A0A224YJ50_9ACAR